ncbi:hypothetical protein [Streptomyces sp. NPDC006610]|uniref:hypothetical protein n=1 Tax=Streptomyces sp. NPDC006610 TaxID=3154584 RepID=UPI0033A983B2
MEEWAGRIASDTGYAALEHTVELTGICITCQSSANEGEPPRRRQRAPDAPGRVRSRAS